jgi:cation:H+ antiporter
VILDIFILIFGLIVLYFSADWLVAGSSRLAARLGVPPLVIGLTVVAFGTSMPELLVSVTAALRNSSAIALGNVVGSNIVNIALILGLSALIRPLGTKVRSIRMEAPFMVLGAIILVLTIMDSMLGRLDGLLFSVMFLVFVYYSYRTARKESVVLSEDIKQEFEKSEKRGIRGIPIAPLIAIGLCGLVLGAHLLVNSAIGIAIKLNLSETFIGLSIVALGTSLPELATSTVAAYRGENDISIGNIIGSNIFNTFGIIGISALIHPLEINNGIVETNYMVDLALMVILSLAIWLFMYTGKRISRGEGVLLILVYLGYLVFLTGRG